MTEPNKEASKLFFGGMPTEPDVKKLKEKFKTLDEGTLISYKAVSKVIGEPKGSCRFMSVTHQWRKQLFVEKNILLTCVMNEGYLVSDPSTRVRVGVHYKNKSIRDAKSSGRILIGTDTSRLSADEKRTWDRTLLSTSNIIAASATEPKPLNYPEPN